MNATPSNSGPDGARLAAMVCARADQHGERMLIDDGVHAATGAEVAALIRSKTDAYRRAGVQEAQRVGAVAWPPLEFITDVFAVLGLGAVVVPLPRRVSPWELDRLDAVASLTHLAAAEDSPLRLGQVRASIGPRRLSSCAQHTVVDNHGAASGQLTSGTTGRQRLALRPADALAVEAEAYSAVLGLTPDETILCPVPLHHAYGFGLCVLAATLSGTPVRYVPADRPRSLLNHMDAAGACLVPLVPPMLRVLAKASRARSGASEARLMTAGMPVDQRTAEMVDTALRARLGQVYGTTETGPICVTAPTSPDVVLRSLGPTLPGVAVRLAPDPSADGAAAAPDTGLVTVSSPMAMLGYADGARLDTDAVTGPGFVTGDLGRITQDGLVLVGRVSNCINVAGAKVSPEEIEAVILGFPAVRSCLVHGVTDEYLGQRINAIVTPDSVDLVELERHCAERLSPPRLPHVFKAVSTLATTEMGKVIRLSG